MDFDRLLGATIQPTVRTVIADWMVAAAEAPAAQEPVDDGSFRGGGNLGRAETQLASQTRSPSAAGGAASSLPDLPPPTASPAALRAAANGLTPPQLPPGTDGRMMADEVLSRLAAARVATDEAEAPPPVVHQRLDTASADRGERHVQTETVTVVTIALGRPADDPAEIAAKARSRGLDHRPGDAAAEARTQPDPTGPLLRDAADANRPPKDPLAADAAGPSDPVDTTWTDASTRTDPAARERPRTGPDAAFATDRPEPRLPPIEPDFSVGAAILNAAMIPGWPPPRPFATSFLREIAAGRDLTDPAVQDKIIAGLGALGFASRFLEKLRRRLRALARRPEIAIAAGVLFASIMSVMEAAAHEIEAITEEEEDRDRGFGLAGRFRIDER